MPMPDTRGFIVLGLFMLTAMIFVMLFLNPAIANVQLFGVLATAVISGGLGASIGFYFGSSQTSAKKDATIASLAKGDGTQP